MVDLVKPGKQYHSSYLKALTEFAKENRSLEYRGLQEGEEFEDYLERVEKFPEGIGLPDGFVPETVLWLVDQDEFIGEASIRHVLNYSLLRVGGHIGYLIRPSKRKKGFGTKILKLSLKVAKSLGIKKALLTCDETNIGSAKIIEKNGGILEDATDMGQGLPRKLRYWIKLEN
jgi:predicted acetyltransferase